MELTCRSTQDARTWRHALLAFKRASDEE